MTTWTVYEVFTLFQDPANLRVAVVSFAIAIFSVWWILRFRIGQQKSHMMKNGANTRESLKWYIPYVKGVLPYGVHAIKVRSRS